jgi:exopolysaccharide biosynthesis polyprenyl glycosylphosphotransferase
MDVSRLSAADLPAQRLPAESIDAPHAGHDQRRVVPGLLDTTAVLPYVSSATARRTRRLRAWMLTMPVDLAALLAPLLWNVNYYKGTIVTALLTVVIFALGGLYRGRRHLSILDELPSLCGRLLVSAGIVAIIAAQRHDSVAYAGGLMQEVAYSAGLVLIGRAITRKAVLIARRKRWVEHTAIIIGGGPTAAELARLLRRYPQYGLRFAAFVDRVSPKHAINAVPAPIRQFGELEQAIAATGCDVLIVADVDVPEDELFKALSLPGCAHCDLWIVPRLRNFHSRHGIADHIGAIPVMPARRSTLSGVNWAVKRGFDIVFATVALVVVSPVLLLCALATRIESGPGVLFRQQRVTRDGRTFDLIKLRSLRPADDHESSTNWTVAGDPRIGPVGRFLRRTSLDELPQLWNILRGDMTVVGPRPERPYFVDRFSASHPDYAMRHRVPAGLTGLAQVSGLRGDTPITDRARFDNYYIENWSLWLDVKVILRTAAAVFSGGGR